jgi:hypothetical protein
MVEPRTGLNRQRWPRGRVFVEAVGLAHLVLVEDVERHPLSSTQAFAIEVSASFAVAAVAAATPPAVNAGGETGIAEARMPEARVLIITFSNGLKYPGHFDKFQIGRLPSFVRRAAFQYILNIGCVLCSIGVPPSILEWD